MITRATLIARLNNYLNPQLVNDFCPNGLQVEGCNEINKIVTGVTASQALIERAIEMEADTILVHHGYFWKGEPSVITGMKYNRIKALITHNINLIAYHLPLDIHPNCGNNVQLGELLNIENLAPLEGPKPLGILYTGNLPSPSAPTDFLTTLKDKLGRDILWVGDERRISSVAWCTGGGQGYIESAAEAGIDAFITGEISEQTVHVAREMGIHFFCAGHHATERYGVKALGDWLSKEAAVEVNFVDLPNPA